MNSLFGRRFFTPESFHEAVLDRIEAHELDHMTRFRRIRVGHGPYDSNFVCRVMAHHFGEVHLCDFVTVLDTNMNMNLEVFISANCSTYETGFIITTGHISATHKRDGVWYVSDSERPGVVLASSLTLQRARVCGTVEVTLGFVKDNGRIASAQRSIVEISTALASRVDAGIPSASGSVSFVNKRVRRLDFEGYENQEATPRPHIQAASVKTGRRDRRRRQTESKALSSEAICFGECEVEAFSIGSRDECGKCAALLWKHERSRTTICCSQGKVSLPNFVKPTDSSALAVYNLFRNPGPAGNLIRRFARQLNNALTLASQKVSEVLPSNGGFTPSVVIQGKLYHRLGSLEASTGEAKKFAQIYIHDPQHDEEAEARIRLGYMRLPKGTTADEKAALTNMLLVLQSKLKECNPYIKDFRMACELDPDEVEHVRLVIDADKRPTGEHARRYNAPTGFKEINVLIGEEPGQRRDIVLRVRGNGALIDMNETHRSFDALHFVLLFPEGDDCWNLELKQLTKDLTRDSGKRVAVREFYAYHLHERREGQSNMLFKAARLFQEYCCMAFAKIENQRLHFLRMNQDKLRADSYQGILDHVNSGDAQAEKRIGQRVVLPSSFTGGPRHMNGRYQDAMACVRVHGKPDLFITMTCNPDHPDIIEALKCASPNEHAPSAKDRPDIVARVFQGHLLELLDDLVKKEVFGKVAAYFYSIEFQKRGLPHAHILIILAKTAKLKTVEQIDNAVCAELPKDPELRALILKCMLHRECGARNPNADCMHDGNCRSGFPKEFTEETYFTENDDLHPHYRRRPPSDENPHFREMLKGREVDNRWVVPFNPYLTKKFKCHINVEICTSVKACKYLFKYIHKGHDRTMVRNERDETAAVDEISEYQDLRSIGSSEACWRIYNFDMGGQEPSVTALPVHLENGQRVYFKEGEEVNRAEGPPPQTPLTEFFNYNETHPDEVCKPTYADFPRYYVWDGTKKEWKKRKRSMSFQTIGRSYSIHPTAGEVFYLRMLLHHEKCAGATSFEDLKTLDGVLLPTFKEVCVRLGLLQDDTEWDQALNEAELTQMCPQVRGMFCTILEWCSPSNPRSLFDKHFKAMGDDIVYKSQPRDVRDELLRAMVLLDIEKRLLDRSRSLHDFDLDISPELRAEAVVFDKSLGASRQSLLERERSSMETSTSEEKDYFETNYPKLFGVQKNSVDAVIKSVLEKLPSAYFFDAIGGAGKTFCENLLLAWARSEGKIALAVATSGIAATLLRNGRTAQGRFKLPIILHPGCTWNVSAQSDLAALIKEADLIIWDEVTMANKLLIEALEAGLRDLMQNELPFGGKVIVFAGDFRQTLPIVKRGNRSQIVKACLKKSKLWPNFKCFSLLENMRLRLGQGTNVQKQREYGELLLQIGNGTLPNVVEEGSPFKDLIKLPEHLCIGPEKAALIDRIFPDLNRNWCNEHWLCGRAILAPKNSTINEINMIITKAFPGPEILCESADSIVSVPGSDSDELLIPREYLITLNPSGLPPHRLILKVGMVILLLRNLDPINGLCNGTRLVVQALHNKRVLQAKIIGGHHDGRVVHIPRISLLPNEGDFPFNWQRRQFPVNVAFAMTINKAQGQSFSSVGVYLTEPSFAHGQLYVAASRTSDPDNIVFALPDPKGLTRNIVYKEVI